MKNRNLLLITLLMSLLFALSGYAQKPSPVDYGSRVYIFASELAGQSPATMLGRNGPQLLARETEFAQLVTNKLGMTPYKSLEQTKPGDYLLTLMPVGDGIVANPNPPSTVAYSCIDSTSTITCQGSDGSSSSVSVAGGASSISITPGRDSSYLSYGAAILVTFGTAPLSPEHYAPEYIRTYEENHLIDSFADNASFRQPWQWAWRLCERRANDKSERKACKKAMEDLWKRTE